MTKPIEFTVPRNMRERLNDCETHVGLHILNGLRQLGVPVEGALFPVGVSSGRLEVEASDDLASDDWVWRWHPA